MAEQPTKSRFTSRTLVLLLIPVIAVVQFIFTQAVALLVSAGNVFFRDLGNVARHVLRLWFYLSPGLYAFSRVADSSMGQEHPTLIAVLRLNPFVILFESYRAVIYGTPEGGPPTMPDWGSLAGLLGVSLVILLVATFVFKRVEPTFAKIV